MATMVPDRWTARCKGACTEAGPKSDRSIERRPYAALGQEVWKIQRRNCSCGCKSRRKCRNCSERVAWNARRLWTECKPLTAHSLRLRNGLLRILALSRDMGRVQSIKEGAKGLIAGFLDHRLF